LGHEINQANYPKKALEWWEINRGNTEVTPKTLWPIAKSLLKRDGPRGLTAIYGFSGLKFYSSEIANAIADSSEIQFAQHILCDQNHDGE
jgi:hypothetical protein